MDEPLTSCRYLRRRRRAILILTVLAVMLLAVPVASLIALQVRKQRATDRLLTEARAALAAREYDRAYDLLRSYLQARPDDPSALLLAARAARRQRAFAAAQDHLQQARAAGGPAEATLLEQMLLAVERGDDSPVPVLRRLAERDDETAPDILEVLIQYDLDTYQLTAARDGFSRYLRHRPDDLLALLGRAFVWERLMCFADALEDYRRAVAAHPNDPRARLKLADTLLIIGTPDEARSHYQYLLERNPRLPPARLGLARCCRRLGESEEAAQLLDELLREYPDHGETLWERGELETDRNQPEAAEAFLRKAAARLPHDRRVQYALYRCLLRLGRTEEAQAVHERVARIDADLQRLDRIRDEVIRRPNDPDLRYEGGLIFLRNGEHDEAIRWLRLALRLDPNHRGAQEALQTALAGGPPVPEQPLRPTQAEPHDP